MATYRGTVQTILAAIRDKLPAALGQTTMAASLPVTIASNQYTGTYTERSGTITLGGTAQEAMAANTSRKAWFFQNIGSGDLWISFVETAAVDGSGSVKLAAGASAWSSANFVSTQALSIIGATTGQKFTLWEA